MYADPSTPTRPARTGRRTTTDRLLEALRALGEHRGQILSHTDKAWASITFAGARHTVIMLFAGEEAAEAGERFIEWLPEHEFTIPGRLVADATVVEAEHRLVPSPRLVVTCEILVLEEG